MGNEKTVQITSRIVTVINIIETIICAFVAIGGLFVIKGVDSLFTAATSPGTDGIGTAVAGVGGVVGAIIGYAMLFVGIFGFIYFLIPSIRGIVLWANTKKKLEEGTEEYFKAYKKDGINKLVINGLPIALSVVEMIADYKSLEAAEIIAVLIFMMIPAIAVYQIIISIDGGKQK